MPWEFPVTPVLDDFDRANENPATGWTHTNNALKVVSNRAMSDSDSTHRSHIDGEFPPDVEAYVELSVLDDWVGVYARYGSGQWYSNWYHPVDGWSFEGGYPYTYWSALPTPVLSAGDAIGVRCHGPTIEAWARVSGVWQMVDSVIDYSNDGTGVDNKLALSIWGTSQVDNFSGGPSYGFPTTGPIDIFSYEDETPLSNDGNYAALPNSPNLPQLRVVNHRLMAASFPQTPVLDDFNRANGAVGSNWNGSGLVVNGNQLAAETAAGGHILWATAMSGADVEAYVEHATLPAATGYTILTARDNAGGTFYGLTTSRSTPHFDCVLVRRDAWVETILLNIGAVILAAGDAIGIRCVGTTIEAWARISGTWTLLGSAVDASIAGTGSNNRISLLYDDDNSLVARFDNFGGGEIPGYSLSHYTKGMPGADVEAYVEIDGDQDDAVGLYARTDADTWDSYSVFYNPNAVGERWTLHYTNIEIDAEFTPVLSAGDALGIRCQGDLIQGWARVSGVWQLVLVATHSTNDGASPNDKVVIEIDGVNSTTRLDRFGGGVVAT